MEQTMLQYRCKTNYREYRHCNYKIGGNCTYYGDCEHKIINPSSLEYYNELIAKWLGWEELEGILFCKDGNMPNKKYYARDLMFHCDSNWQWVCLEKIAKESEMTIANLFQNKFWKVNTKQDLFEAIIRYIENSKKE